MQPWEDDNHVIAMFKDNDCDNCADLPNSIGETTTVTASRTGRTTAPPSPTRIRPVGNGCDNYPITANVDQKDNDGVED